MPCFQQVIHTSYLMDWYQLQQERRLGPSCPFCREEPPMTVLEDLANKAERALPPEKRQFNCVAVHRHNTYLHYKWNKTIPTERDAFFSLISP